MTTTTTAIRYRTPSCALARLPSVIHQFIVDSLHSVDFARILCLNTHFNRSFISLRVPRLLTRIHDMSIADDAISASRRPWHVKHQDVYVNDHAHAYAESPPLPTIQRWMHHSLCCLTLTCTLPRYLLVSWEDIASSPSVSTLREIQFQGGICLLDWPAASNLTKLRALALPVSHYDEQLVTAEDLAHLSCTLTSVNLLHCRCGMDVDKLVHVFTRHPLVSLHVDNASSSPLDLTSLQLPVSLRTLVVNSCTSSLSPSLHMDNLSRFPSLTRFEIKFEGQRRMTELFLASTSASRLQVVDISELCSNEYKLCVKDLVRLIPPSITTLRGPIRAGGDVMRALFCSDDKEEPQQTNRLPRLSNMLICCAASQPLDMCLPTTLTNLDIRYNLYKFGAMHVEPLQRLVNLCILSVAFTGGDGDRQFLANMGNAVSLLCRVVNQMPRIKTLSLLIPTYAYVMSENEPSIIDVRVSGLLHVQCLKMAIVAGVYMLPGRYMDTEYVHRVCITECPSLHTLDISQCPQITIVSVDHERQSSLSTSLESSSLLSSSSPVRVLIVNDTRTAGWLEPFRLSVVKHLQVIRIDSVTYTRDFVCTAIEHMVKELRELFPQLSRIEDDAYGHILWEMAIPSLLS